MLVLLAVLLAPPSATAPTAPAIAPTLEASQVEADLDAVLSERGKAYLEARARLEARPALAAPRIAERLRRVPAPTPADERRLLALLAGMARSEDLEMFATQLRRDVAASHHQTPGARDELRAAAPWRTILREQGAAALPVLTALVGDREFSPELRALLIADMVGATPPERLPELVALVGAGAPELRVALRQALGKRAQTSASERAALIAAVEAAIATGDPPRRAALIGLRAAIAADSDGEFMAAMIREAGDEAAPFIVRVAALRVLLTRAADPAVQASLQGLAARHLDPAVRERQASEILGALALQGLAGAVARGLVNRLALLAADAPRIASVAYGAADLPAGGEWLTTSQTHPWPEVRSAALARVAGPCGAPVVKQLAKIADATGRHGEAEAIVAREAIAALGRCGGEQARRALTDLLDAADQEGDRRAEAGRQLIKYFGSVGADAAAAALNRTPDTGLALRLLRALQRSDVAATPAVREALCSATEAVETAAAARQAIAALLPGEDAPCGERSTPERPDPEKPRVYMQ
ncbi:MAG: hypothetical protein IPO88_15495 [Nannocystis sp.]|uniref:hypothetical protein n=1 Tax=Nannocystis sp. TaxID=1962667 RepID=UPI002420CFB7|nr:hypothetical protein [Nannocystis sp.]MBK9754871.1 hypothetical protein [Nannocystis sp.]